MTDIENVARVGMALCQNALGGKQCPCAESGVFKCADEFPGQQAKAAIAAMQPAPQWQGIESAQRSLMDQIKHDAALVAALPEHERKNYERELRSLFCNPGITFPTPPVGGSDATS